MTNIEQILKLADEVGEEYRIMMGYDKSYYQNFIPTIRQGYIRGFQTGFEKVKYNAIKEIAKNFKELSTANEVIEKATGLSIKEIEYL